MRDGFYAPTLNAEMKSPDLEVNVLVGMADVTARVQGAAKGIAGEAKALKAREAEIAAIEKVAIAPPSMARTGVFMQPGQISSLIARHPDADAIVLFVGLAGLADLKGGGSDNSKSKLVLVSNYESYDKALLQMRAIQLAIVPRVDAGADEDRTIHSPKQWFERHYLVVTPERVAELGN